MKKLLTWLLCLMMLVSAVPALAYTTGTYTGTGTGMLDKIEVAVTFDADTITGIEVVSCNDTPGVCDAAVEKIPAEIVKYQSLGVDVATSATFTSNGILEAVADAVKQAGGDVDALKAVPTTNAPTITGDGIVMAKEIGAALIGMGQIQLLPLADPVTGSTSNIIGEGTNMYVNQEGKRFVNESSRRDVLAKAILKQTGSYCYVISTFQNSRMDSDYKNNYHLYLTDLIASGAVVQADTLEELAEKIGCPVDTFVETCTNFNKYVAESNDPECGRVVFPDNAALEMEGPFYACKRAPAVHHTMGGIKVNVKNQALAEDGSVIPGLYAAGEVTGGFHGSNRLGGNAISEVITTGRNAATNLMAE